MHSARVFTDCYAEPRWYDSSGKRLLLTTTWHNKVASQTWSNPASDIFSTIHGERGLSWWLNMQEQTPSNSLEPDCSCAGKSLPQDKWFSVEGYDSSQCGNWGATSAHFCTNLDANNYHCNLSSTNSAYQHLWETFCAISNLGAAPSCPHTPNSNFTT